MTKFLKTKRKKDSILTLFFIHFEISNH